MRRVRRLGVLAALLLVASASGCRKAAPVDATAVVAAPSSVAVTPVQPGRRPPPAIAGGRLERGDEAPLVLRYRTLGSTLTPGAMVGLYGRGAEGWEPVGVGDAIRGAGLEIAIDVVPLWIDPRWIREELTVGPLPDGHVFGNVVAQVVGGAVGTGGTVALGFGRARGVAVGELFEALAPAAELAAPVGRGAALLEIVEVHEDRALARVREGSVHGEAWVRALGRPLEAPSGGAGSGGPNELFFERLGAIGEGLAELVRERGSLAAAAHRLEAQVIAGGPALGENLLLLAGARLALGDGPGALRAATSAASRWGSQPPREVQVMVARALLAVEDYEGAEALLRAASDPEKARGAGRARAAALVELAELHVRRWELDAAVRILEEEVAPLFASVGAPSQVALTHARVADIHLRRGDYERALQSLQERALPGLGEPADRRRRALALDVLAETRLRRGELDEALRIRGEDEVPLLDRLGDRRGVAIARLRIAEILIRRGELDRAGAILDEVAPILAADPRRLPALLVEHRCEIAFIRNDVATLRRTLQAEIARARELGDHRRRIGALAYEAEVESSQGRVLQAFRTIRDDVLAPTVWYGDERERAYALGRMASIYALRGLPGEALQIFTEEALPRLRALHDERAVAAMQIEVASILTTRGEVQEAERILREEVIAVYERLGELRARAIAFSYLATIYELRGERREAERILREEEVPVYERLGDARAVAVARAELAGYEVEDGRVAEALAILEREVLPVHRAAGDVGAIAAALSQIAEIHQIEGDLDASMRLLVDEVIPLYDTLGNVGARTSIQLMIADIKALRFEYDEALKIAREAAATFKEMGDIGGEASALSRVSDYLAANGEYEVARGILRKEVLPLFRRSGDVLSTAYTIGRLASIYFALGDYAEALRLRREEELPVYERVGAARPKAVVLSEIADCHMRLGETDRAIEIYRRDVLPAIERVGNRADLVYSQGSLGYYLLERGRPADRGEAATLLKQALAGAEAMKLPSAEWFRSLIVSYGL